MSVWLELSIVAALILLNGVFAMAEMAVVSSRRIRLQHMAESGSAGAALALQLSENPARFLSAIQVGITLIGILSGAFGGATLGTRLGVILNDIPAVSPHGPQIAFFLVVVAITALSVVVGEIVPKRIALLYSERIAAVLSRPLQGIVIAARPLVWLLENATALLLRLLRIPQKVPARVTEEEVKLVIAEGTKAGAIAPVEKELLHGVLALADNPVTSAMTPRPDIYWIDLEDDPKALAHDIAECPYSRLVVVRGGDIGRPLGVVQKKDLVNELLAGDTVDIEKHMLEPTYVPEHISVLRMLEIFKATPLHLAFVVDEYGDFLGLITLTDILGAVAGYLPQEHEADGQHIRRRKDGTVLVDGRTPIEELANTLGLAVKSVDFHTAAGLALDRLTRIPAEGDAFMLEGWRIEVIDMDGKRVDKLLFVPPQPAESA